MCKGLHDMTCIFHVNLRPSWSGKAGRGSLPNLANGVQLAPKKMELQDTAMLHR